MREQTHALKVNASDKKYERSLGLELVTFRTIHVRQRRSVKQSHVATLDYMFFVLTQLNKNYYKICNKKLFAIILFSTTNFKIL